jgi:hypothetical protein
MEQRNGATNRFIIVHPERAHANLAVKSTLTRGHTDIVLGDFFRTRVWEVEI